MEDRSPGAEALLKKELAEATSTPEPLLREGFSRLSSSDLGSLFVSSLFLRGILKPLIDEEWLGRHDQHGDRPRTASPSREAHLQNELRSVSFLADELSSASPHDLKTYFKRTTPFLHALVSFIQAEPLTRFRETASVAMVLIDRRARELDTFPHGAFSEAMYRAFDAMDEILGIRYELDLAMPSAPEQRERLFEGAGAGVQTSYSSILLALDRAGIANGGRVLDLGSGYGRVGFVIGLLRPDLSFTGYEYVDHRVQDSKAVALRAGLTKVSFETQDLSAFLLPRADVYYMYDPFSRETYAHVLDQLIVFGRQAPVTIITKGRANTWVRDALHEHGWSIDETCDSGTVCLFKSPSDVSL